MRVQLGEEAAGDIRSGAGGGDELAGLIRDYREHWQVRSRRVGHGYQAQHRPPRNPPGHHHRRLGSELRAKLGEPDGCGEPEAGQGAITLYLSGDDAERMLAADAGGDPERWQLADVSTGEIYTPYAANRAGL